MTVYLLDGNILTALCLDGHVHHEAANRWFHKEPRKFATCPITEGTLLRLHMQMSGDKSSGAAWQTLSLLQKAKGHVFWADNFSYREVKIDSIHGHRQVTDTWLAELARRKRGRIATFDGPLAAVHRDIAELVPI